MAWVKALLKEGIMVAEPTDLLGIRGRLEEEARRQERERIELKIQDWDKWVGEEGG